jgi:ribosomal protein L16 Arg81 hydroxylase
MIDFGLTPQDFRSAYFEQKPHHFRGALRERPFSWTDIDQLLHVVDPSQPFTRLFHHGIIPEREFTRESIELGHSRRRLDKAKFYGLMGKGATLVINWLENYSVAAKRLCVEVGRFAGAQTSGNAYMSFKGDGTFGKHWDTHDVFAIHLLGRKRWRIFAPTFPLPLTYQTNDRSGQTCPAEPALEVTLEEGDILYLPRGWWHHAVPLDVGSFHLSVGSYPPTLYDYVLWTTANYLAQRADTRRAFSPTDYREALATAVQQLPQVLFDSASAAEFQRDAMGREPLNAELNVELFLDPKDRPIPSGAVIRLTTCHSPTLERGEVLANGARLSLDRESQAVVTALRGSIALRYDALGALVPGVPAAVLHRVVLDLARRDIVTIQA